MENRSYHSLSNSWGFTTGSKRSTPDQTHELIHGMEEGRAVPCYGRVASDLVDFDVISTSRAGIVTTLAGPSTSVVKSERLIQLQHGDVKRGDTPSSKQFSPSSKRSKRARSVNLNGQIPFCQVYGCNLNLTSSKEYHKKHKVCEMHSKTAKVIVNGLEQRFCQQCSRFHLLAEFDDGKRSCRKRLAGHNQRRRKPQIEHKHYGHKFMEMMIPSPQTPFLCANILSAGIGREVKYGTIAKGHSCVKAEATYNYHPSSLALNQHGNSKQLSTFQASSVGICSEDSERYSLDHLACVSSSSKAQLMKTFPDNESFFATQGITSVSDTGRALSLLSTRPHNFFIQSSGMTTDRPLFALNDHGSAHSNANPLSGTVPSYSQFSTNVASNRFFSSGHNRMNVDHLGALPVSDASTTDIKDHIGGTASSLDCMNEKNGMYTDQVTSNVGTFHLSSQFHGMNGQRSSMQVKMAKEDFMSCIGL